MTRIICRAAECVYWEDGICGSEEIEYDPDVGCLTFEDVSELTADQEEETFDWGDESDDDVFDEEEEEEDTEDGWEDEEVEVWHIDWDEASN